MTAVTLPTLETMTAVFVAAGVEFIDENGGGTRRALEEAIEEIAARKNRGPQLRETKVIRDIYRQKTLPDLATSNLCFRMSECRTSIIPKKFDLH